MEKDIAVNRIVRDMRIGGIICEDCIGEVRKYVDLAWVAGYENGRFEIDQRSNKKIGQYDRRGILINVFKSRKEAAKMTHYTERAIYNSMYRGAVNKHGWNWKYIDEK